jgi:hypothetical protein
MQSRSSETNTWTFGCATVSCQMRSACSRGSAKRLTSDAAKRASRAAKSEETASRAVGIPGIYTRATSVRNKGHKRPSRAGTKRQILTTRAMIEAIQSADEAGRIIYRAKGVSRPNLTMLAEALGVPEGQLSPRPDPEFYAREMKLARRRRGPQKSSMDAFFDVFHNKRD